MDDSVFPSSCPAKLTFPTDVTLPPSFSIFVFSPAIFYAFFRAFFYAFFVMTVLQKQKIVV